MTNQLTYALPLPRGSDIYDVFQFKVDDVAVDMSGYTIEIFDADAWGKANGSITWTDQAAGEARIAAKWAEDTPDEVWFRVRTNKTADDFNDAYPKIVVRFT